MSASMTVSILNQRFAVGYRILRQAGKRIELSQDPYHGASATIRGNKRCRHSCYTSLHRKTVRFQMLL